MANAVAERQIGSIHRGADSTEELGRRLGLGLVEWVGIVFPAACFLCVAAGDLAQ